MPLFYLQFAGHAMESSFTSEANVKRDIHAKVNQREWLDFPC